MRHIFSLLCLFFFSLGLNAQDHIQFKSYTITDGLSQSTASTIIQDELGALWIGTQDGINRFNGKNFEVYTPNQGYDIVNGHINTAFKDRKGNLWFGSQSGLIQYNPKTVTFTSHHLGGEHRMEIYAIQQDQNGNLWLGSSFGRIYQFNIEKQKLLLIDKSSFNSAVIDIQITHDELIFVSEYDGVLFTNSSFETKRKVQIDVAEDGDFKMNKIIQSPFHDFVVSTNRGVFYYDKNNNSFRPEEKMFATLKDKNIIDAIYLSPERLLVATENAGLYQIIETDDSPTYNVLNYRADAFQKGALLTNKLTGLFQDNRGIIWIGSERGISSFNSNFIGFKGVGLSSDLTQGLPSQNVWGFEESPDERYLYVAMDHGVSRFDRHHHFFQHFYRHNWKNEDNTALTLQILDSNRMLVGGLDGLYELQIDEKDSMQYTFQQIKGAETVPRGFDIVYTIVPFKNPHEYLMGTRAGVMLYNTEKQKFKYLYNQPDVPNAIGSGPCRFIFQNDNSYYVSPESGGLYEIFVENGKLTATDDHSFTPLNNASTDYFSDAIQVSENEYLFSTIGDGIMLHNIVTKDITQYNESTGLPNDVIYEIEKSSKDSRYVWLTTNKGVVAFDYHNKAFYSFTEKDGLRSNELNQGACFVSKNGEIYFGGILGYNYLHPKEAFYVNTNLDVYFTGIEVENEPIFPEENGILSQSIAFTSKIVLPYKKRSIKLRFFGNDLTNPDRIEYKYILKGGGNVEENLGNTNEIRLTSLAPGNYEISVYARIINGEWNLHPAKLKIEVERPFWLAWWFYVLLLIALSLYILYRVRQNSDESQRRQIRLEMKIAERTRELRKKNTQIESQKAILEQQTIELEQEKEKSERLLNNILPRETASQLKKDGRATAREFEKVSIMFTDFVGFSKIAEKMSAQELVSILDRHFRKFDEIIDRNNLEKIKTIGDAYMCAGGVPIRDRTNPINTALAAVQIRNYMSNYQQKRIKMGKPYWKMRIGINTGPVSAGVIGTKRYAYDIWGNTVNRAQRMEKFCEPGKIAITEDTFEFIEPYFECHRVGKVKMKSGVKVMMYEVDSIKPELSIDGKGVFPNDAFYQLVNLHHYSQINYQKAERFILNKLKNELDPKLHYHSYSHSLDVTRQAERIAIEEGITDEDLFLLKSAASFHDAGFIEKYDQNEPVGARMAAEILPKFGYTQEQIEVIKELIYVTRVPHQPKNLLEEIICDADLDYLGRDDFHKISALLCKELKEHGRIPNEKAWDEQQVKFFKQHKYFTQTAIRTRLPNKKKHLEEIKQRLAENRYHL